MKIMQLNVVYKKGSTGKIIYDIHRKLLENGYQSVVCYGRGAPSRDDFVYKIAPEIVMKFQSLRSRITGYIYGGCFISTYNTIKLIKEQNPDIVHLHCVNGYIVNIYRLLDFLKISKIKTVLTLHAEFMHTAGCGHAFDCMQWVKGCCKKTTICPEFNLNRPRAFFFNRCNQEWNKMSRAFEGFDNLIICPVSDWLKNRAQMSPFLKDKKFVTVKNGLDSTIFKVTDYDYLKKKHSLTDQKIIVHVTPNFNSEIKGGKYVIEIAKRLENENVKIFIIGFNGNKAGLPSNVVPVSHTNDQKELAAYYSMADLTLLTSKKETFSMICAESLCCGTEIVGFKAGGPETISMPEYSAFVEYADIYALDQSLRKTLLKEKDTNEISIKARKRYDNQDMFNTYARIYNRMLY